MISGYTIEAVNALQDLFSDTEVRFCLGGGAGPDILILCDTGELGISTLKAENLLAQLRKVPSSNYMEVLNVFKRKSFLK
jgi:hypothetical protein